MKSWIKTALARAAAAAFGSAEAAVVRSGDVQNRDDYRSVAGVAGMRGLFARHRETVA